MHNDIESRKKAVIALTKIMDDTTIQWTLTHGMDKGCFHGGVLPSMEGPDGYLTIISMAHKHRVEIEFSVILGSPIFAKIAVWFTRAEIEVDEHLAKLFQRQEEEEEEEDAVKNQCPHCGLRCVASGRIQGVGYRRSYLCGSVYVDNRLDKYTDVCIIIHALRTEIAGLRKRLQSAPESRITELLRNAVNEACTCGGGGPGECCAACEVWHNYTEATHGDRS